MVQFAVTCPVCAGQDCEVGFPYESTWRSRTYNRFACKQCQTVFIDPLPDNEELASIYCWTTYHQTHYLTEGSQTDLAVSLIKQSVKPGSSVLDFGCGAGHLMRKVNANGFDCHGVEYTQDTIAALTEQGLSVSSLDDLERTGRRFDLVCACDVLLHLRDIVGTCRRLEKLLIPGGLFMTCDPLEANPSLVLLIARTLKRTQRLICGPRVAMGAPTMLYRLHRKGHRYLMTKRLDYRETYAHIYETGWPYFVPGAEADNIRIAVRRGIGLAAIAAAKLCPQRWAVGNRVVAIYRPDNA